MAVVAALGGIVALGSGFRWPTVGLAIIATCVALVPLYGLPPLGRFTLHPGLLGLWAVAIWSVLVALVSRTYLAPTDIDKAFLLLLAAMFCAVLDGSQPLGGWQSIAFVWIGPYMAGRFLVLSGHLHRVIPVFVAASVVLALGVLIEASGVPNLFVQLFPRSVNISAALGTTFERLGSNRTQGSFGQPIPLAIFCSAVALLSTALAAASDGRRRAFWVSTALLLVAAQATTQTRLGWVVLAVGVLVLLRGRMSPRLRVGVALAAIAGPLVLSATRVISSPLALVSAGDGPGDRLIRASTTYRERLIGQILEPSNLSAFGHGGAFVGPGGSTSIDSAFLDITWHWGWVAGLALLMVLGVVVFRWLRSGADPSIAMVAAPAIGLGVAFASVAFISQEQIFFWLLVGALSATTVTPQPKPPEPAVHRHGRTPDDTLRPPRSRLAGEAP